MATEIERKFLVPRAPDWLADCPAEEIEQGYLAIEGEAVEVRLRRRADEALLTVKQGEGRRRTEVEIEIGAEAFAELWPLTEGRRIRKVRHRLHADPGDIEVDVYAGDLEGLIVAEIEFASDELSERFQPPEWLGTEVTGQAQYANKSLATAGLPAQPGGVSAP